MNPSIDHLSAPSLAVYVELPKGYDGDVLHPKEMLESLHSDCVSHDLESEASSEELVRGAYAVARNIGDKYIVDTSPEAGALLNSSRSNFNLRITARKQHDSNGAAVRVREPKKGVIRGHELSVDVAELSREAPQTHTIQERLKRQGVYMSDQEISYLMLLRTAAHEAAHVIQYDIGRTAGETGGDALDFMSKQALLDDTAEGDPSVANERFAETYAEVVLQSSLDTLGWDENTIDVLTRAMSHRGDAHAVAKGYDPLSLEVMIGAIEASGSAIKARNNLEEEVPPREKWMNKINPSLGSVAGRLDSL